MNRQARKTRKNITDALLALMLEKPLYRVTVKEITDRAGISRVAFYYHYTDVRVLFESIQEQAIEAIAGLLVKSLEQNDSSLFERKLFAYVKENQILFKILIKEGFAPAFILKTLNATRQVHAKSSEHVSAHLQRTDNQILIDYQFIYMAGGTLFMIFDWIAQETKLSYEKIAMLAEVFNQQVASLKS